MIRIQQSEKEFQSQVIELARLRKWMVAHFGKIKTAKGHWTTPAHADGKGFPDLVLVRGSELIFAELKIGTNRLTKEQTVWMGKLIDSGQEYHCWRPDDWAEIQDRLW